MNKSILIIDTPKECWECPLCTESYDEDFVEIMICRGTYMEIHYDKIPSYCPLKPLPMRAVNLEEVLHNDGLYYVEKIAPTDFDRGFNYCLEKILGEKIDE